MCIKVQHFKVVNSVIDYSCTESLTVIAIWLQIFYFSSPGQPVIRPNSSFGGLDI